MDLIKLIQEEKKSCAVIIMDRKSIRHYYPRKLNEVSKVNKLVEYSKTLKSGPFGTEIYIGETNRQLGTYKFISHRGSASESPGYFIGCINTNIDHPKNRTY